MPHFLEVSLSEDTVVAVCGVLPLSSTSSDGQSYVATDNTFELEYDTVMSYNLVVSLHGHDKREENMTETKRHLFPGAMLNRRRIQPLSSSSCRAMDYREQ